MTAKKKFVEMVRKKGLYLKDAGHKGRGVFCSYNIARDEILEVTPAIILNEAATDKVDATRLGNYTFVIGGLSKKLQTKYKVKKKDGASSVVMGILSFCNHADGEPNATVEWQEKDGSMYYVLRAVKRIPKHTEICTTYGEEWFESRED
jgi:SET domain-containing protein